MSTATTSANSLLDLIFRASTWNLIAENDTTSPATNLVLALHTAAPASSAQTSNEATYGSYARVNVARSGAGWSAAASGANENAAAISFPVCTSGTEVITHVSIGDSGGTIIFYGALTASRTISSGITPQFAAAALTNTQT